MYNYKLTPVIFEINPKSEKKCILVPWIYVIFNTFLIGPALFCFDKHHFLLVSVFGWGYAKNKTFIVSRNKTG